MSAERPVANPRHTAALWAACVVVAGCSGAEAPEPELGATRDSTVLVATAPEVPSTSLPSVVFLGTSLTAGFGLGAPEDGYVHKLSELADSAGTPFHAINAGVSGETSAGGLRRLDWILRQPIDVLVLELGANDGLRGQDPDALESNLTEIIRRTRVRNPDITVILAGMEAPPNLGPLYTARFRAVFPRVAESEDVTLIPFLLDGVAGIAELNQVDRIHPTAEGHDRVARVAWPYLLEVLQERTR